MINGSGESGNDAFAFFSGLLYRSSGDPLYRGCLSRRLFCCFQLASSLLSLECVSGYGLFLRPIITFFLPNSQKNLLRTFYNPLIFHR